MNLDALTDDSKNDALGPHYFTSREVAEKFIADFQAEHFAPMVKKFADDLYEAGRERFEEFCWPTRRATFTRTCGIRSTKA